MEDRVAIQTMRDLERRRVEILRENKGNDSKEEDAILDEMDVAWRACSQDELDHLNQGGGPYNDELLQWLNTRGVS